MDHLLREVIICIQKALWMVDEVEARWQRFIHHTYPSLKYLEVYWESTAGLSEHTFENAVRKVATLLQIKPETLTFDVAWKHEHVTVEYRAQMVEHRRVLQAEEEAYMLTMKNCGHHPDFSYLPPTYNSFDLPSQSLINSIMNDTDITSAY
jgi:hypothetical protein